MKNTYIEVVTLKEELNFVQVYINLQKTRFKEGLIVEMATNPGDDHRKIAPVTLQILIENAIKHNVIDSETPLKILIRTEKDYLVVSNNLQRKNVVETSNRQGLANLRSLYEYLSDRPIIIMEDDNHFTLKIPLI